MGIRYNKHSASDSVYLGSVKFFYKKSLSISVFAGYRVSVIATQFCCCSGKAAIDNTWTIKRGYVAIKFYLWIMKFEFHMPQNTTLIDFSSTI